MTSCLHALLTLLLAAPAPTPVSYDQGATPDEAAVSLAKAGFAVAASGYSSGGYAVREAVADAEALRRYFIRRHGSPRATWVAGQSMGGSITVMLMELHPATYDGGLAMCAPLGPASPLMSLRNAYDSLMGAYRSDGYSAIALAAGRGDLFAQRYAASEGHCSFTSEEVRAAMAVLRRWRETGAKPPTGADFRR